MAQEADSEGQATRFYTVEFSAGAGGLNRKDDVMLVQYYLRKIYEHPFSDFIPPTSDEMKVDGGCGPITRRWISDFQQTVNGRDGPDSSIKMDGRVDPTPKGTGAPKSRTMVLLNKFHAKYFPEDDVRHAPDAPSTLRNALAKSVVVWGGGI